VVTTDVMTGGTVHEERHDVDGLDEVDEISAPRTEQVRIVGAERAADAVAPPPSSGDGPAEEMTGAGAAAGADVDDDGWSHADWPAPEEPQLLHWTEAPTGEVPAVLSRGADVDESDPWAALPEPSWREERHDWEVDEPLAPSLMGGPGEEPSFLSEVADEDRQPWSFDLDAPVGRAGSGDPDVDARAFDDLGTGDLFAPLGEAPPRIGDVDADGEPADVDDVDVDVVADVGEKTRVLPLVAPGEPTGEEPAARNEEAGEGGGGEPGDPAGGEAADEAGDDRGRGRPGAAASWPRLGRRRGEEADAAAVAAEAASEPAVAPRRPSSQPRPDGVARVPQRRPPAVPRTGDDALSQRAGRNIPAAVASGLIVGGLALLAFHYGTVPSMVVVTVVLTAAAVEAYAALRHAYRPATLLGLVAVAGLLVGTYDKPFVALPVVVVLLVAGTFLWHLVGVDRRADPVRSTAATLLVFCWVGVFGSYAALLLAPSLFPHRTGIAYLLGALIAAVAYDVGALVVGAWAGRHPLSTVSPGKTWEGLAGGAVAAIVFAVAILHLVHPWTISQAVVLGVVVAVVSPIGDLCESLVKRHLGLKDMGRILPGHGGLLDRVDGLLFVLPATYYLVRAFGHG